MQKGDEQWLRSSVINMKYKLLEPVAKPLFLMLHSPTTFQPPAAWEVVGNQRKERDFITKVERNASSLNFVVATVSSAFCGFS